MSKRPETGPMVFDGDWTGVFVRGDWCWDYTNVLRKIIETGEMDDYELRTMKELLALFRSSHNGEFQDKHESVGTTQKMKNFIECKHE